MGEFQDGQSDWFRATDVVATTQPTAAAQPESATSNQAAPLHVPPPSPPALCEVGDRVQVVRDGRIGTVVRKQSDELPYKVEFQDGQSDWFRTTDVVATTQPTAAAQPQATSGDPWRIYDWNDMPPQYQNAWSVLGHNQYAWDNDRDPPALSVDWCELTSAQQEAASAL